MAHQFKTARLSDLSAANTIDDKVVEIDELLAYLFGIDVGDLDTNLTGNPFEMTLDGQFEMLQRFRGAGSTTGVRIRDTDTGDEFAIMCDSGYLEIKRNDGSEATPSWTSIATLNLTTGVWAGSGNYCVLERSATQTIGSGSDTAIEWDTEEKNEGSLHDLVTNPSRITAQVEGLYSIHAAVTLFYNPGSTDQLIVSIARNGLQKWRVKFVGPSGYIVPISGHVYLTAGQYIEILVYQGTGSDQDFTALCSVNLDVPA